MSNPKLALIPSGYKGGTTPTVYSILPSDGSGDFTFDRANGFSTRVRKDGLIEEVSNDTPRLDWLNSNCPNLLLESERTNRQVYSEELDNSAWQKQPDLTVTADEIISPNGELNADKIQRGSTINTNNYVFDTISKSSAAQLDIAISVFVKQGEGDFFAMRGQGSYSTGRVDFIYQFSTDTITANAAGTDATLISTKSEHYGNGWYRLSLVFNSDANASNSTYFSPRGSSGNIDSTDTSSTAFAYVWGVQVEEGNSVSSYIPTTTAQTRFADVCSVTTPSGVTQIVETFSDDTTNTITTIPSTYTISSGKVKKVIMT